MSSPILYKSLSLGLVLSTVTVSANALDNPVTGTPYLSESDSPFNGAQFSYWYLENFEDGALNTPGISVSSGSVLAPGALTDSVDSDDGLIDGHGSGGHSFYPGATSATFTFDRNALGRLPTHFGFVWTDVGFNSAGPDYKSPVSFEAFDSDGNSLGTQTSESLGDGLVSGETGEDRFFGVVNSSGISAITIQMISSQDWEIDHVQYGAIVSTPPNPVPVPAGVWLLGSALVAVSGWRKKGPASL